MPRGPSWRFERLAWRAGYRAVAGVDEAGRGCLAGPVVAAAVVLDPDCPILGVNDSKRLSARRRASLFEEIRARARAWSVALVGAREIDRENILRATRRAMAGALQNLDESPHYVLVDAVRLDGCGWPYRAIVRGDQRSVSIAAASVIAKVTRDRFMQKADRRYPGYGFARHKGYGTADHLAALRRMGASPLHRQTFRGVLEPPPRLPFC